MLFLTWINREKTSVLAWPSCVSTAQCNSPSTQGLCFFVGHSTTGPRQWVSVFEIWTNGHWTEADPYRRYYLRPLRAPKLLRPSEIRTCLPTFHLGRQGPRKEDVIPFVMEKTLHCNCFR